MLHGKALFSAATIVAVMTAAPLALAQSSSTAGSGISANTAIGTPSSGYGSNGGTSSSRAAGATAGGTRPAHNDRDKDHDR